jgi:hypothetical protein
MDRSHLLAAFSAATDFSKQQSTFAIALVSLTVALSSGFQVGDRAPYLIIAWVLLVLSLACGLFLLGQASGQLVNLDVNGADAVTQFKHAIDKLRWLGIGQLLFLSLGLALLFFVLSHVISQPHVDP